MKGTLFFYFCFTFLFSILGYIIDSFYDIKQYEIIKNLKGPWDLNFGLSLMLSFFIYYIFTKIWNFKSLDERSILQTFIDVIIISINTFVFSIFTAGDFKYHIAFMSSLLSYLLIYPNIYLIYKLCKSFFSNEKRKNEQYFLLFITLIPYILIFLDVFFLIKSLFQNFTFSIY